MSCKGYPNCFGEHKSGEVLVVIFIFTEMLRFTWGNVVHADVSIWYTYTHTVGALNNNHLCVEKN